MAETRIKSSGLSANISVSNLALTGTTSVSGNIVPTSNNAVNLGTPTLRFGSLYLSGNTIDIGGAQITTSNTGSLTFNTGSGNVSITANTVSFLSTVANTTTTTGNVSFSSNLAATSVTADAYFYTNGAAFTGGAGSAGYTGSRGDSGIGFTIAKTYASVAALTADTAPTGITAGQFAIIETGNANNSENSRLYLWSGTAYSYVTDLSGSQGITGASGAVGYTGSSGSAGSAGSTGYTGSAGSAGTTGNVGYTGSSGSAGSAGTTGYTGSQGVVGYTGSTGTAGTAGYTGSRGTTAFTAGNTAPASPSLGDMWYRTANDVLYRYLNDGTASYWIDVSGPVNNFGVSATTQAAITASGVVPPSVIGQSYGGGYYAGKISTTGNGVATHYLIVAPKATGESNLAWKISNTSTAGTSSLIDGPTNTNNMNDASHPAAYFCKNLSIGGYTDWYMPAKNEMITLYWYLKAGTENGDVDAGSNQYAVSPEPISTTYTTGNPPQTIATAFQSGNSEALSGFYHMSTENTATMATLMSWYGGNHGSSNNKTVAYKVRAVRRIPI